MKEERGSSRGLGGKSVEGQGTGKNQQKTEAGLEIEERREG
jgi:hypothetical protein